MTLEELARVASGWVATERRLFEVMGSWVREMADPPTKAMLAAHSRHHGWRAEVLAGIVPIGIGLDAPAAVHPAVEELAAIDGDAARVHALYDVALPAVLDSYRAWLGEARPAADGAVARWVRLVVADAAFDLADGQAHAARLLECSP